MSIIDRFYRAIHRNFFTLMRFDFIVDAKLKVYLTEVGDHRRKTLSYIKKTCNYL